MDTEGGRAWTPLRGRLPRSDLERYLRTLARRYHFLSLSEAVEILAGRREPVSHGLVITFDDGYRNNRTHALPVLRRHAAPMTLFVPSGKVNERSLFAFDRLDYALQALRGEEVTLSAAGFPVYLRLRPRKALAGSFARVRGLLKERLGADVEYGREVTALVAECEKLAGQSLMALGESDDWSALLDWEELRSLARESDVEIGSHTVLHTRLGLADAGTVRRELRESKDEIEMRAGVRCHHLAYPNGSWNAEVAQLTRDEGYRSAATTDEGVNPPGHDLMALRRVGLPAGLDATELLARVSGLSEAIASLKARATRLLPDRPPVIAARARG